MAITSLQGFFNRFIKSKLNQRAEFLLERSALGRMHEPGLVVVNGIISGCGRPTTVVWDSYLPFHPTPAPLDLIFILLSDVLIDGKPLWSKPEHRRRNRKIAKSTINQLRITLRDLIRANPTAGTNLGISGVLSRNSPHTGH